MIYLDANATTPLHPDVRAAMLPLLGDVFGNPSSVHFEGQRARAAVDSAREQCARVLGAPPKELIFTSGGTESAALALLGMACAALDERRSNPSASPGPLRLVTSAVEHACVVAACVSSSGLASKSRGFRSTPRAGSTLQRSRPRSLQAHCSAR